MSEHPPVVKDEAGTSFFKSVCHVPGVWVSVEKPPFPNILNGAQDARLCQCTRQFSALFFLQTGHIRNFSPLHPAHDGHAGGGYGKSLGDHDCFVILEMKAHSI